MELAFVIWAVGTLPVWSSYTAFLAFLVALISFFAWAFCTVLSKIEEDELVKSQAGSLQKVASKSLKWGIAVWFVACMIPDKTTSYQMLSAYGVQKVVENPQAQELASDGVDVLKALMEKAKKELAEDKK